MPPLSTAINNAVLFYHIGVSGKGKNSMGQRALWRDYGYGLVCSA